MSDAKKCDRCGKFYIEIDDPGLTYSVTRSYYNLDSNVRHDRRDLCPTCGEEFYNWLRNPPVSSENVKKS